MQAKKIDRPILLCWLAAGVIAIAFILAMIVQSGLKDLSTASEEVSAVAGILDSASGLRSLLISFSNQCSLSQESWTGALNTAMGLLFLVSMLGFALLIALVAQIRKNRRLKLLLSKKS